jgi:hypothetical protein
MKYAFQRSLQRFICIDNFALRFLRTWDYFVPAQETDLMQLDNKLKRPVCMEMFLSAFGRGK